MNTLRSALRNIKKQRSIAVINGLGLVLGLAVSALVFFYVYQERGYDRHHPDWQRIYRVSVHYPERGAPRAGAPFALADFINENTTGVTGIARLTSAEILVARPDNVFKETRVLRADASAFDIFAWKLIAGDKSTALQDPHSVVLTKSAAIKYFGRTHVVGEVLNLRTKRGTRFDAENHPCRVSGVIADMPVRSHVQGDLILPMATMGWGYEDTDRKRAVPSYEGWGYAGFYTYVKLDESVDAQAAELQLNEAFENNRPKQLSVFVAPKVAFIFTPISDIHLTGGQFEWELSPQADGDRVALFAVIAGLILLTAIINTIILSMAQAARRVREIGIRKINGAGFGDLSRQLLGESVFFAMLALPFAAGLVIMMLPTAENLFNVTFDTHALLEWPFLLGVVGMTLLTGMASGLYLSISLARITAIQSVNTRLNAGGKTYIRNGLIVLQLLVFLTLSAMAMVIYKQVNYLFGGRELGFEPAGVVSIEIKDRDFNQRFGAFKRAMKTSPFITAVSCKQDEQSANYFSNMIYNKMRSPRGGYYWSCGVGREDGPNFIEAEELAMSSVDPDYVTAMGMQIIEGRNFDENVAADRRGVLVNETFVRERKLEQPVVGQEVKYIDEKKRVVGIIKDFHTGDLYNPIPPLVLKWGTTWSNQIVVKLDTENQGPALAHIRDVWEKFCPDSPLDMTFLEDQLADQFAAEVRFGRLLAAFALFAIVIAVMGLWGLAAFIATQKTHEIGVRKVLGASVGRIVRQLTREFVWLVIAANVVAGPVVWHLAGGWLQQYAYRIDLNPVFLAITGGFSLVITLMAVNLHVIRAARIDPVKTLRNE